MLVLTGIENSSIYLMCYYLEFAKFIGANSVSGLRETPWSLYFFNEYCYEYRTEP